MFKLIKDEGYKCSLDEKTARKAKDELNENTKQRLTAVETLRSWVESQNELKFDTDIHTLLLFLRSAKFSQLRARELILNNALLGVKFPQWFRNIDVQNENILGIIDLGYVLPLPKKDKEGRQVILYRSGVIPADSKRFSLADEIQTGIAVGMLQTMDENVQVNGIIFVFDMTDVTMKHMNRWTMDEVTKWTKCWQNSGAGRLKAFHHYNGGVIFDAMMTIVKPFLSKKFHDRMYLHDTLESLYQYVDPQLLPEEYLPDDYDGPSVGSIADIIGDLKKRITNPEFRQLILHKTNLISTLTESSIKTNTLRQNASFQKLQVD